MSKRKWSRPFGQIQMTVTIVMLMIISAPFISIIMLGDDDAHRFLMILPVLFSMVILASYNDYRGWRGVWHSVRTQIKRPTHLVLPDVFKALTDADIPFVLSTEDQGGWVKRFDPRWDQVLDLDYGELRLHLLGNKGHTILFLGPVKKGNEREVARVKGLIEGVAGET